MNVLYQNSIFLFEAIRSYSLHRNRNSPQKRKRYSKTVWPCEQGAAMESEEHGSVVLGTGLKCGRVASVCLCHFASLSLSSFAFYCLLLCFLVRFACSSRSIQMLSKVIIPLPFCFSGPRAWGGIPSPVSWLWTNSTVTSPTILGNFADSSVPPANKIYTIYYLKYLFWSGHLISSHHPSNTAV